MPGHAVPTGAQRQALFDELSAIFRRCSEQEGAIERERDAALRAIPDASVLLAKRDAAVRDARRKADAAEEKADRAQADAVQAADREFFDAAQTADAKRQQTALDTDRDRDAANQDANDLLEETLRSIHNATAGLQAIADAERRARDLRDKAVRAAEQDFRDAIRKADSDRETALDAAMTRQIVAHAAADEARSRAIADAQRALTDAIHAADRLRDEGLAALPAAQRIVDDGAARREALEGTCAERKRAIEARLRGDDSANL